MPPILTVWRIGGECAFIDERGGVGIRLEPAARDNAVVWRAIPLAALPQQACRSPNPPTLL
jgi:hypothetical protein